MKTSIPLNAKALVLLAALLFIGSCSPSKKPSTEQHQNQTTTLQSLKSEVPMVKIEGFSYVPFYGEDSTKVEVEDFLLDERPVTHQEFLEFVKKNPQWRKSEVKRLFADQDYLKDWPEDLKLPEGTDPLSPVVQVSWFAARAYAKSVGKRLPTLNEWELVALADETSKNATGKKQYSEHLIELYNKKYREKGRVKESDPNIYGVYNLFDLVWEWTEDFNSIMITSDSRNSEYDDKGLFCAGGATNATDKLNYAAFMRYAMRASLKADFAVANLGFRCAKDL